MLKRHINIPFNDMTTWLDFQAQKVAKFGHSDKVITLLSNWSFKVKIVVLQNFFIFGVQN